MAPHPADDDQRNGEIWSTRIQQELLALTTDDGADLESTSEARSILPPFVAIREHALDLAAGTCLVAVRVDVPAPKKTGEEEGEAEAKPRCVLVAMEACLARNEDGSPNTKDPSYPFVAPVARLTKGKDLFPEGSTIEEGDKIGMDLDWTPSLHLVDAILNVALKIKESILQGEPFHAEPAEAEMDPFDELTKGVDEVAKGARRLASSFSQRAAKFGKSFTPKASDRPVPPRSSSSGSKSKKKSPRAQTPGAVTIGDEINLLEEPWVNAHGVYSCKAIRRPPFIEEIMAKANDKEGEQTSSSKSMFRSFAQSARSVMEESFLMVTETHIIEIKASKLNLSIGKVVFCIPIDLMAKLKFRREESLSLFFKNATEDPLIYLCPDSGDAVKQIQGVLKRKGVRGKHTNAAAYRAINEAMQIVQDIQTKEMAIEHEPTVARVNEIMDLYRQAAERFEVAGDVRHEEVVTHMRKFLAKPTTVSILDGSYKQDQQKSLKQKSGDGKVAEGEVLEATEALLNCGDDEADDEQPGLAAASPASDKEFEENIDSLLKDAKADFENFDISDDELGVGGSGAAADDGVDEMTADLDAMMKEAHKEMADLLS